MMAVCIMSILTYSGIHKDDKQKIKQLLYHFLPDLFFMTRGELSDDEEDHDGGNGGTAASLGATLKAIYRGGQMNFQSSATILHHDGGTAGRRLLDANMKAIYWDRQMNFQSSAIILHRDGGNSGTVDSLGATVYTRV